ncbi:MAG TPA: hypothetical protein VN648_28180, partial [Candidatus Methylomirabilis sp.]|nr:hypothetical protein [Candidatus Methylomirabilis sp.]
MEVWVDGAKRIEADAHLTKREVVDQVETLGGTGTVGGGASWDGRFHGLAKEDLRPLQVEARGFELRLPDGSVGQAVLPNGRNLFYLQGLGDAPLE